MQFNLFNIFIWEKFIGTELTGTKFTGTEFTGHPRVDRLTWVDIGATRTYVISV